MLYPYHLKNKNTTKEMLLKDLYFIPYSNLFHGFLNFEYMYMEYKQHW